MALLAGTGYALKAFRSVRVQPLLTRAGEAMPPKSCAEYGPSASRIRRLFSTTSDADSLLRDNIKAGVSKAIKEALGHMKNDGDSILKLSVIKSGVNAAVKESLKDCSVYIDYTRHDVDPVVKAVIEEAVMQGLNKFVHQLYMAPLKGEMMGPYLLKLALKEGFKEGLKSIHNKFTVYVDTGMDLLIRELFLIKDQTKPKVNVNEDFVQVWFCGLVHRFLNKKVIWCVDKGWIMLPYVAGAYLFVLFSVTLIESKIPPWEYHKVLNCYRVHGLESTLKFYQEKKDKKKAAEEEKAKKKKAEEEAAAAAKKKKAEEEAAAAAKKKKAEEEAVAASAQ